jgi:hypothetical protein
MGTRLGARERGSLGGSAFAALVGAHALTYFVAAPSHHDRAELLHETGHGSWTSVFILAGAALVAALVALSNRWASPRDRDVPPARLLRFAWTRLVPFQILGFIALECAERAFAHGSLINAATEPVVLLGVGVQIVAAIGCGLLLVAFTRLVRRLRANGERLDTHAASTFLPPHDVVLPCSATGRAWNVRGPPLIPRSC